MKLILLASVLFSSVAYGQTAPPTNLGELVNIPMELRRGGTEWTAIENLTGRRARDCHRGIGPYLDENQQEEERRDPNRLDYTTRYDGSDEESQNPFRFQLSPNASVSVRPTDQPRIRMRIRFGGGQ